MKKTGIICDRSIDTWEVFEMRKCIRCQTEMIEDCSIRVEGAGYGIIFKESDKLFAGKIGKPKAAVCPKCGEVSIYLENVAELPQK